MSQLTLFNDQDPLNPIEQTQDQARIAALLAEQGVRFEQWQAEQPIATDATSEQILAAYASSVNRLKAEGGYQTADTINLNPDHPDKVTLRQKFLDEHQHSEDEVRFFVKGDGLFYLHLNGKVFAVQCTQGDLISVPANTRHWFDMGSEPNFTCIRLFTNTEGWVAQYTGDKIASQFPTYEALTQ